MKNRKKIVAVAASLVAATTLLIGGAFAFFIDKDWTSDVGVNGTVYLNVEDLEFTNSENINPGDYDKNVYIKAVENDSTSSLRPGTEHKITFRVDNVGTKSIMTRNVVTITVENTLYEPVYHRNDEGLYAKSPKVAPDNHMYYCDFANNTLEVVEDELGNKHIRGTEIVLNESTGKYEYYDAVTNEKTTFDKGTTKENNIVHWRVGNLPADAYYLLYDVELVKDQPNLVAAGINKAIVTKTTEVDCIPTNGALHTGTDLYALHSEKDGKPTNLIDYDIFPRNFFSSKSTAISIRYITPQISLSAPEGSIEDKDGTGSEQTIAKTQGGVVYENDLDTVFYRYWLAMDKDVPNIYNGATVYLDLEVQGMQYRNTSDKEWDVLFTQTYKLTVENAEQGYTSIHTNK